MNDYEEAIMQLTSTSNFADIWNRFIENSNQPIYIDANGLEFQGLTKIGDGEENVDSVIMFYGNYELVISLSENSIEDFTSKIKAFDQKENEIHHKSILHIVLVCEIESTCIH